MKDKGQWATGNGQLATVNWQNAIGKRQTIFNLEEVVIHRIVRDPKFGLSTGIEQVVWPEVGA